MNTVKRPDVQWRITIIFDWKMVAVVSISTLTWLLMR